MAEFETRFFAGLGSDERDQLQGLLSRLAQCVGRDEIDSAAAEPPCEPAAHVK
jgi:hypothetical protein